MQTDTAEATDAYPALSAAAAFRDYFQREGYIVVRHALPPAVCAEAVDGFLKEVHLDTHALFQRQASPRFQRHAYTGAGHMREPILHLPDLSGRRYPQFKAAGMALLTDPVLRRALETLLGEPARLVRSLYCDGGHAGFAQRDAELAGGGEAAMIGAWIAAEDSDPGAGRVFVLPRSHLRQLPGEPQREAHGARYPAAMAEFAARGPLAAPTMRQGDLLLWNAMAVHGSLPGSAAHCAHRAFTGYYTARARGDQRGVLIGGVEILHHPDRRGLAGRAAMLLRSAYAGACSVLGRLKPLRRQTPP